MEAFEASGDSPQDRAHPISWDGCSMVAHAPLLTARTHPATEALGLEKFHSTRRGERVDVNVLILSICWSRVVLYRDVQVFVL